MNLYRCNNKDCVSPCQKGHVFLAEAPEGTEGPLCNHEPCKSMPDDRRREDVSEICFVHFEPRNAKRNGGLGYLACDPSIKGKDLHVHRRTCDVRAVTCPFCKATDAFKLELETTTRDPSRTFKPKGSLPTPPVPGTSPLPGQHTETEAV